MVGGIILANAIAPGIIIFAVYMVGANKILNNQISAIAPGIIIFAVYMVGANIILNNQIRFFQSFRSYVCYGSNINYT